MASRAIADSPAVAVAASGARAPAAVSWGAGGRGGGEGVEGLHIRRVELPALGAGPRHLLTVIAVRFAVPSLPGGRAR